MDNGFRISRIVTVSNTGRLRRVADSKLAQNFVDNSGHHQRLLLGELVALFLSCSDCVRLMPHTQCTTQDSGTVDGATCMCTPIQWPEIVVAHQCLCLIQKSLRTWEVQLVRLWDEDRWIWGDGLCLRRVHPGGASCGHLHGERSVSWTTEHDHSLRPEDAPLLRGLCLNRVGDGSHLATSHDSHSYSFVDALSRQSECVISS
eukprot:COSAG02_NODE_4700_length_5079_cov_1134.378112_2_plen_203_part_00